MKSNKNYYQSQMSKLDLTAKTIEIKLYDYEGNKTNQMTLTEDCIEALLEFIKERRQTPEHFNLTD